jgi:hypothetical protein
MDERGKGGFHESDFILRETGYPMASLHFHEIGFMKAAH